MSDEDPKQGPAPGAPPPDDGALNDALDELEGMLGARGREGAAGRTAGRATGRTTGAGAAGAAAASGHPGGADSEGQYSIPLLSDVVIPGEQAGAEPAAGPGPEADEEPSAPASLDEEVYRQVVSRLASEIEVIVQAAVEQALADANARILDKLRRHIEITLPEILDDIATTRAPDGEHARHGGAHGDPHAGSGKIGD